MYWKNLKMFIVLVLLAYLVTLALIRPTTRVQPAPGSTRTPRPTFTNLSPSPIARILAPTRTPRPTGAPLTTVTSTPPPIPSTPPATLPPTVAVVSSPTAPPAATHVVRAGESLTGIAQRYGISMRAIAEVNGLTDPDCLSPGQVLLLPSADEPSPASSAASSPTAASSPSPPTPAVVTHVVKAGENLTSIARRHGVTVEAIVVANGLTNPDRLYVDQILILPLPGEP